MKILLAVLAVFFAGPAFSIDLDQPGALEALARENPAHYAKVQKILSEAPQRPFASVRGWMRTEFDARDVDTSYLMKTSYPALARITFTLDERQYTKVIRIDAPAKAVPAK